MRNLLASFLALCCVFTASEITAQWISGPVDTLTSNEVMDQNGPEALAIDSSGTLHLVWRQEGSGSVWRVLYMKKEDGGDWGTPDEIPSEFLRNGIPAIEVEYSTGTAHVVWHGLDTLDGDKEIQYATNESGSWETNVLTDNVNDDDHPTIVVDASGNVHLSWITFDTLSLELKLMYASNASGDWTTQTLEKTEAIEPNESWYCYGYCPGPPSIGISPGGVVHVSYGGVSSGHPTKDFSIRHIENYNPGAADWEDEEMETASPYWDEYSFTAIGEQGDVHMVVCGPQGGEPLCSFANWYFYRPDGSTQWDTAQEALSFQGLGQTVLALDTEENVHLVSATGMDSYQSWYLLYTTNTFADGWRTNSIINGLPEYTCYHRPSLVIDSSGFGHLVFYNSHSSPENLAREILYTKSAEPLWPKKEFVRGDVDQNQHWAMQDAIFILKYVYVPGSPEPTCTDAADVDDNGAVQMNDALHTLRYLYVPGNPPPPPPYPDCGIDPTWDELGCGSYSLCE